MGKRHSPHDQPLADEATRIAGFKVSRTQIEDWREASALDLVRSGSRPGEYTYAYAAGSAELAADLAAVLKDMREDGHVPTLDAAILVSFVHEHNPKERGLRKAYDRNYAAMGLDADARTTEREATKLGRRASRHPMTRALKEHVERPGVLPDVLTNLMEVARGLKTTISAQTGTAVGETFGLTKERAEYVYEHMNVPGPSLPDYAAAIRTATFDEMKTARNLANIFVSSLEGMMGLLGRELGLEVTSPEGLPEIFNELLTAIAWIPHAIIKREEKGPDVYDAAIRSIPDYLVQERDAQRGTGRNEET